VETCTRDRVGFELHKPCGTRLANEPKQMRVVEVEFLHFFFLLLLL